MSIKKISLIPVFLFLMSFATMVLAQGSSGEGTQNYLNAEKLRTAKNYTAALVEYDKALAKEPNHPGYLFSKGICYLDMKEMDKALQTFEATTAAKNDHVKAYEMQGRIHEEKKNYDKAVSCFDNAAKFETDKKKKLDYKLKIIKLLNRAHKYSELGGHIAGAKELAPDNMELLYLEARNNNILGNYQAVVTSMDAFIKGKGKGLPTNQLAQAYYELGLAYYKMEQYDKAMPALQKADFGPFKPKVYELKPEHHVEMATVYSKVYDYDKSEEYLNQALKINPQFKPALDLKLRIDETKKDKTALIKKEEDSIKLEKNHMKRSELYCRLCRLQFDALVYDGAMMSAEECIRIYPRNMPVRFYKAMALYKLNQMEDAIITLDGLSKAPQLDPETLSLCHFAMGLMYKKSQQTDIAKQYFRKIPRNSSFANAAKIELKGMAAPGAEEEVPDAAAGETDAGN